MKKVQVNHPRHTGNLPPLVMEKNAYNTMELAVEAAGGLVQGEGNPLAQRCGCLLSIASLADGRDLEDKLFGGFHAGSVPDRTGIYAPPQESEPVLTELYRLFGMPPAEPNPRVVYRINDAVCPTRVYTMDGTFGGWSWDDFTAHYNIVPSA